MTVWLLSLDWNLNPHKGPLLALAFHLMKPSLPRLDTDKWRSEGSQRLWGGSVSALTWILTRWNCSTWLSLTSVSQALPPCSQITKDPFWPWMLPQLVGKGPGSDLLVWDPCQQAEAEPLGLLGLTPIPSFHLQEGQAR